MTHEEQLQFIESCDKDNFIKFAKEINVFRTLEEENYLIIKNKILSLLSKFNLTTQDIEPNQRILSGTISAGYWKH